MNGATIDYKLLQFIAHFSSEYTEGYVAKLNS